MNLPWTALYIYWFGLYMKFMNPKYASNKYVHSLGIPSKLFKAKYTLLDYRTQDKIWRYKTLKQIYLFIIDKEKFQSIIVAKYPEHGYESIWKEINNMKNIKNKIIRYTL